MGADTQVVTIDGPSASGKSTVARGVARALGRVYVDSGSLYRAITLHMLRSGVDTTDPGSLVAELPGIEVDFVLRDGSVSIILSGDDPGETLRSPAVREAVSPVAEVPEVRARVVEWLRAMPSFGNIVVEGRDIGSAVFPDAPFKFYLDASPGERARRRHGDLKARGEDARVGDVKSSLERRDHRDSSRATAPLVIPEGATVIDTDGLGIDVVVAKIVGHITASGGNLSS